MKRFGTGLSFKTKTLITQKTSVGARKMVLWLKHALVLQRTWIWWFAVSCSLASGALAPLISIADCIPMHGSIHLHTSFWKSQSFFKDCDYYVPEIQGGKRGKHSQNYACSLLMLGEQHGSQDLKAVWDGLQGPRVLWLLLRGSLSRVLPEHLSTNANEFY